MNGKSRKWMLVAAVAGVITVAGGIGYAAIPAPDGVINGCYKNKAGEDDPNKGQLRVVESAAECKNNETAIQWTQRYVAGEGLALTGNVLSVADGGVDGANITDESLTGTDLENNSVATSDIQNESLSGTDIKDESLSGDELAAGSVATSALGANAVNDEADFPHPRELNSNSQATVASATITIPTAGSPPADHRVLVIGQAVVEWHCLQCTADGIVEWELWDEAGPSATRLLPSPYAARFSDTFITSVSHVFTAPAGEHTIALKLENRRPGPNFVMEVTHASLSVIDLGSV